MTQYLLDRFRKHKFRSDSLFGSFDARRATDRALAAFGSVLVVTSRKPLTAWQQMAETGFDEAEVDEDDLLEYDCSEHGDGTEDADGGEDSAPEVVAHDCGEVPELVVSEYTDLSETTVAETWCIRTGVVAVTPPTGSGKSLYLPAALARESLQGRKDRSVFLLTTQEAAIHTANDPLGKIQQRYPGVPTRLQAWVADLSKAELFQLVKIVMSEPGTVPAEIISASGEMAFLLGASGFGGRILACDGNCCVFHRQCVGYGSCTREFIEVPAGCIWKIGGWSRPRSAVM